MIPSLMPHNERYGTAAVGAERPFVFIQRLATDRELHEMESVVTDKEMTKRIAVHR